MPETGYQVLNSEREGEVHFQFTPNIARSKFFLILKFDLVILIIIMYWYKTLFNRNCNICRY